MLSTCITMYVGVPLGQQIPKQHNTCQIINCSQLRTSQACITALDIHTANMPPKPSMLPPYHLPKGNPTFLERKGTTHMVPGNLAAAACTNSITAPKTIHPGCTSPKQNSTSNCRHHYTWCTPPTQQQTQTHISLHAHRLKAPLPQRKRASCCCQHCMPDSIAYESSLPLGMPMMR